jgi:NAD+ kinase
MQKSDDWISCQPVSEHSITLKRNRPIQRVLIIRKRGVVAITEAVKLMIPKLLHAGMSVLLEANDPLMPEYGNPFASDAESSVDLCICVGGDGTLLHLNSLFQTAGVPPIAAFAMGTLSFLTNLELDSFDPVLLRIGNAHVEPLPLTLRMRLMCHVSTTLRYQVLNELVVYRGTGSHLVHLEVHVDEYYVTSVLADGLIVGSPTGSTAYSMSAGGSMVSPLVPALLITPICPHSLSFRPLVLPDSSTVTILVKSQEAFVGLDGNKNLERRVQGDRITVSMSQWPCPMLSAGSGDWFRQIREKLKWNCRL